MGLFDKDKKKADFSDVRGDSSTTAPRRQPDQPASIGSRYTVKQGDTLSAIAQREYGDAAQWRRIFEANKDTIKDPDMIHPGQQLNIPSKSDQGGFR